MHILVTGGSGFLGSHVIAALRASSKHYTVTAPRSSEYDLRVHGDVERMYREIRPEAVIHLAGSVGGIEANRAHPGRFFYDNLLMGLHTMHHAHRAGVKKFVTIGTICAYPKFTPAPFKEESLWDGYPEETNAPYGLAKKMLLVQAQGYRAEYAFNAIYLLPVNLYGPGDNYHPRNSHVIPAMIRKFSEAVASGAREVTLWGDGSATREFLYVEDAAEGIVLALEKYDKPEPVNLGSGREISINDLAGVIAAETGFTGKIRWDTTKPNGQPRRCLDVSRARESFGFAAKTDFLTGLRITIKDFHAQQAAGTLREVTFEEGE